MRLFKLDPSEYRDTTGYTPEVMYLNLDQVTSILENGKVYTADGRYYNLTAKAVARMLQEI
jgi:hypothetical protein